MLSWYLCIESAKEHFENTCTGIITLFRNAPRRTLFRYYGRLSNIIFAILTG